MISSKVTLDDAVELLHFSSSLGMLQVLTDTLTRLCCSSIPAVTDDFHDKDDLYVTILSVTHLLCCVISHLFSSHFWLCFQCSILLVVSSGTGWVRASLFVFMFFTKNLTRPYVCHSKLLYSRHSMLNYLFATCHMMTKRYHFLCLIYIIIMFIMFTH